ncbi:MAG: porin [Desulfobacterales bacterium]|nr:porin [Desulfobacterales bacterium]
MKKVIVVLAAIVLMAGSAYASEWNFYGSARVTTFWTNTDESGPDGDTQYSEGLQSNARIGANVKVSDELVGRFEYGASGGNANIRLLYGEWDFGAGKLLVGQDYGPLTWIWSNQVYGDDNDLLRHGSLYSHRHPQIRLTFGGFKIAFINPDDTVNNDGAAFGGTTQVVMPAIELSYALDLDVIKLDFGAGYSTFEATIGGDEEDIDTYVLALGARFDKAGFFMKGNVYYGENVGNLLWVSVDGTTAPDDGFAEYAGGEFLDNECLGFMLVAGYKINDMFTVEAGYGFTQTELDDNDDDESATYYINTTINLAPGVFVVPEVGFFDGKESGDTEVFYYGMKWQINF